MSVRHGDSPRAQRMPAEPPILYSFRRCPYAMRARMALLVSGTTCELREVRLRDKPAALIAASPKATVPVLVLPDGQVIDQSLDIMRWALGRADPEGWLDQGNDGDALIAANDDAFKYHIDRYKYPERHASDPVAHRAAGLALLEPLDARLTGQANLCGAMRRLADTAILPFVRQFAAIDRAWFDAQPLPRLQAWLARHLASPLFAQAMDRFERWRPEDVPVYLDRH